MLAVRWAGLKGEKKAAQTAVQMDIYWEPTLVAARVLSAVVLTVHSKEKQKVEAKVGSWAGWKELG